MMTYALRDGLSFCTIEGRQLFLDLPSDRYFCLSTRIERLFGDLRLGNPLAAEELGELKAFGLIKPAAEQCVAACAPPPTATRSILKECPPAAPLLQCASAATRLAFSLLELKLRGISATIARVRDRKLSLVDAAMKPHEELDIVQVAEAFQVTAEHIGIQDQCLPRSIAVAHRLIDYGASPQLVLGVTLRPFRAHAWVQWRDLLVNEWIDVARHFTPILVI